MSTECSAERFGFGEVCALVVVAGFDGGAITSDAGAADRAIRLTERFAACFTDRRAADYVEHDLRTLLLQRVLGIALGYEDLIDHGQLRHYPVRAILAGKVEARRAGKSTLNRLALSCEAPSRDHRISHDPAAIEALFLDIFLHAHRTAPAQLAFDLDATYDPLHGHQEGRFFHGYYDRFCSLPLYVFCGWHLLAAQLRSNIDAAAGVVEEIARLVRRIRRRWPRVRILLRADSGFCRDALMTWSEANHVDYVFGLGRNPRLVGGIAADLAAAEAESG